MLSLCLILDNGTSSALQMLEFNLFRHVARTYFSRNFSLDKVQVRVAVAPRSSHYVSFPLMISSIHQLKTRTYCSFSGGTFHEVKNSSKMCIHLSASIVSPKHPNVNGFYFLNRVSIIWIWVGVHVFVTHDFQSYWCYTRVLYHHCPSYF